MDEKIAGLFLSHPSNGDQSKLGIPVCSELGVFIEVPFSFAGHVPHMPLYWNGNGERT